MYLRQIVLDTNILVAGLRSKYGVAYLLLQLVGQGYFHINLSAPLVLEYEAVLYRLLPDLALSQKGVDGIMDYHCAVANHGSHHIIL